MEAIHWGVGFGGGACIGGLLFEYIGAVRTFICAGVTAVVMCGLCVSLQMASNSQNVDDGEGWGGWRGYGWRWFGWVCSLSEWWTERVPNAKGGFRPVQATELAAMR